MRIGEGRGEAELQPMLMTHRRRGGTGLARAYDRESGSGGGVENASKPLATVPGSMTAKLMTGDCLSLSDRLKLRLMTREGRLIGIPSSKRENQPCDAEASRRGVQRVLEQRRAEDAAEAGF